MGRKRGKRIGKSDEEREVEPRDAGAHSGVGRAPKALLSTFRFGGESTPPGRTAQPGTDETAISIAAIRRAVSVKCWTSSGLSGRARTSRSR